MTPGRRLETGDSHAKRSEEEFSRSGQDDGGQGTYHYSLSKTYMWTSVRDVWGTVGELTAEHRGRQAVALTEEGLAGQTDSQKEEAI